MRPLTEAHEGTAAAQLGAVGGADRTRVKICGCVSAADARLVVEAGADAIGVILAPSPRRVGLDRALEIAAQLPPQVTLIGVFVDPTEAELERAGRVLPQMLPQFSGSEPPRLCRLLGRPYLKVLRVEPEGASLERLRAELETFADARPIFETASGRAGGSGLKFDWAQLEGLLPQRSAVISGGLSAANVGELVRRLHPYAADVRSGVERGAAKDRSLVLSFLAAVRGADASA